MTNNKQEHQKRYSEAIKKAGKQGMDTFQSWFNKSENTNQSINRGYWDFSVHILTPTVCKFISKPEDKIALEVGFGGGRILNAACSYFKKAIGIDIHNEFETVNNFLKSQGNSNYKLIHTNGDSIPVEDNSVDFVYSFIVLQHLPTITNFEKYIFEIYRCLRKQGIAQLYFGSFSKKVRGLNFIRYFLQGYREITDAPTNFTSLAIRVAKVQKICNKKNFIILDSGISYKTVPDGYTHNQGGQNYITLLKK